MTLLLTVDPIAAEVEPGQLLIIAHPVDDTGATSVRYMLLDYKMDGAVDWSFAPVRRIDAPGPYQWVMDVVDGHSYTFKPQAYFTIGSKAIQVSTVCKAPAIPPPVAAFTVTPLNAVTAELASVSTGDTLSYAWEVDGVAVGTAPVVAVAKSVGMHTVKLTVTDAGGRVSVITQTVPWTWDVLRWTGQSDTANGNPGGGEGLPELTEFIEPYAAFRTFECVNTAARDGNGVLYTIRPQPDGGCVFENHPSPDLALWPRYDAPGLTGGRRSGLGHNHADANLGGKTNVMGSSPLELRFVRYSVMFLPETWLNPDGTLVPMRGVHNNTGEFHGSAGGGSTVAWKFDADNKVWGLEYTPAPGPRPLNPDGTYMYPPLPSNKIAQRPVAPGTWHQMILEILGTTLEQGGYLRLRRFEYDAWQIVSTGVKSYRRTDDGLWFVQDVPAVTDPASPDYGKVFGPITKMVKQVDGTYAPELMNVAWYLYCQPKQQSGGPDPMPPSSIKYGPNPRIGPTLESVLSVPVLTA